MFNNTLLDKPIKELSYEECILVINMLHELKRRGASLSRDILEIVKDGGIE